MDKVKITRKQADSLEAAIKGDGKASVLTSHAIDNTDWCNACEGLNLMPLMTLASALVNGYELDLPKAPETTEILNEVKADKGSEGILTEEELKERNRLLVLENDELNAENMKLKSALNGILNGQWKSFIRSDDLEVWVTERINPKKIALDALEETK